MVSVRKKRSAPALPVRAGISPNSVYLPQPDLASPACTSVLQFLVTRFPAVSIERWRERMQRGDVVDEIGRAHV